MNADFEFKSGYQDSAPAHVPQELVHDFDHVDPAKFSEDPFGPFLALRESAPPIFFSRHHGGFWVVQGYDDLKEVLRTSALFSSWPMNIPYVPAWPRKLVPVELDPPEHKKYQALLAPLSRLPGRRLDGLSGLGGRGSGERSGNRDRSR